MAAGAVAAPFIIPLKHPRTQNLIDDRTFVSIQSETPGVLVFFTLDGSKPASSRTSRSYTGPILLPPGRVCVKAVAVARDGRESSTVTKDFLVEKVLSEEKPEPEAFIQAKSEDHHSGASVLGYPGPRFLKKRLGPAAASWTSLRHLSPHNHKQSACQSNTSDDSLSIRARLLKRVHFQRCDQCSGPLEHLASFCHLCGESVREAPPPTEDGQSSSCKHSELPDLRRTCSTPNSAPSVTAKHIRTLECPKCESLNRSDARFCNWCGAKQVACSVVCCRCGASGPPDAVHCVVCGGHLEIQRGAVPDKASPDICAQSDQSPPRTAERATQTVGLYYPSATELNKRDQLREQQQKHSSERQPPLTATSPGRGYWRKQLDHVCGHLRNFALNNPEFRVLLGEPRLGRIVSALIQEDVYEVSLMLNFTSRGGAEGGAIPRSHLRTLSSVTERATGSKPR
ncbi:double zinc ribbon and ankyrin repeat-containing protein 1 [Synchiropus splendidus]|uniref:double zinc ribbon and ankyrin repeat-containing protein 1 n=1 Tax=Synchiropus splendidus TaxID=270530 RepID=UPI00237DE144|nr:double zinc ribbon and ankyrin repeat-containing protein 1 [Synchiropus splendidus]